jgi:hypothetical protein
MKASCFCFGFLCGVIIYESYMGERHIHIPEQIYQTTPIQRFSPIVGTATVSLDWQPLYQVGSTPISNVPLLPY